MSFIDVQCPCGTDFQREVKRGRPAIWCPECRKVPVAQRVAKVSETGEALVTTDKVSRFGQHDDLNYDQREQVESTCADVKVEHAARVARYNEGNFSDYPTATTVAEARAQHSEWYSEALRQAYAPVRPEPKPKYIIQRKAR